MFITTDGGGSYKEKKEILYECDICHCLPPDRTRHKVNDLKTDYSGYFGKGKVGHELRLKPCWSVLLINPQCNVGLMSLAGLGPKSGSRHVCLLID